jgi:protein-S-isoprenylcysteine O-methyltransferase Ste14
MSGRRRWGVWGVGPRIILVTIVVYIVLAVLTLVVPSLRFSGHRPLLLSVLSWALIIGAVVVWFLAIRRMRAANMGGYLETAGMFAYVRNPIYSAFIFVECPGLVLALWAWPGLVLPFVAFGLYRLWIPAEEEVLRRRHGVYYEIYVRRVPGLVPRRPRPEPPTGGPGAAGSRGPGAGGKAGQRPRRASRPATKGRDRSHLRGL